MVGGRGLLPREPAGGFGMGGGTSWRQQAASAGTRLHSSVSASHPADAPATAAAAAATAAADTTVAAAMADAGDGDDDDDESGERRDCGDGGSATAGHNAAAVAATAAAATGSSTSSGKGDGEQPGWRSTARSSARPQPPTPLLAAGAEWTRRAAAWAASRDGQAAATKGLRMVWGAAPAVAAAQSSNCDVRAFRRSTTGSSSTGMPAAPPSPSLCWSSSSLAAPSPS